jgi:hypothetical protein
MKTIQENLEIILPALEKENGILSTDYKYTKEVNEAIVELICDELESYFIYLLDGRFCCYIKYKDKLIVLKKTLKKLNCILDITYVDKKDSYVELYAYNIDTKMTLMSQYEKDSLKETENVIEAFVLLRRKIDNFLLEKGL